jgi:hypothetical protein
MGEQATPATQSPPSEATELRAEIARQREEVLRLRDLLMARDAELGAARGRMAEMEAQAGKLLGAVAKLRSILPTFVWSALSTLRRRLG